MPPPGGSSEQQPSATGYRGRNEDAPSQADPSFPMNSAIIYEKKNKQDQEHDLPDDVLVEILSRVSYSSYRSLCRFKCVSKPWFALCSHLDIYKRSPQTVSGIFIIAHNSEDLTFHDLTTGSPPLIDPTLAFMGSYEHIGIEQCCGGGLLLCKCWESLSQDKYSYVVCNPATEKWTVLPPIEFPDRVDGHHFVEDHLFDLNEAELYLGFDRVNPSSFVVVAPMENSVEQTRELAIYLSETRQWTFMKSQWRSQTMLMMGYGEEAIFLNGRMHFASFGSSIVTVDTNGKVWREIEKPNGQRSGSIGQSQGYLHYWHVDDDYQLSVWVLMDYGNAIWTLKPTINILELFGRNHGGADDSYDIAIHPYCNLIYLTGWEMTISYDMDNLKTDIICASEDFLACVPYIPCFAKWSSDRKLQ